MSDYAPQVPYGSLSVLWTDDNRQAFNDAVYRYTYERFADKDGLRWDATLIDRRDGSAAPFSGEEFTVAPPTYGRVDAKSVPSRFAALTVIPRPERIYRMAGT